MKKVASDLGARESRQRGRPRLEVVDADSARRFADFAQTTTLEKGRGKPLWLQLKNAIHEAIRDGRLTEGTRLPSEQEMCRSFSLSRPVIRHALAELASEGVVIREARRGAFVAPNRREFGFMTQATGVTDDLIARGYTVDSQTFEFGLRDASEAERKALRLPEGQKVIRILRVYRADGIPLTHTLISLPSHRVPGFEKLQIEGKSIFTLLKEHYGLRPARADRWIRGAIAPKSAAARMEIAAGTPLLQVNSIAFDHDDNPLEYYEAFYNAEVAPLHIATEGYGEPS